MLTSAHTWRAVWTDSAYGRDGFWSRPHPTRHFRTAASTTGLFAERVLQLVGEDGPAGRVDTVVDVGAGEGALLGNLHRLAPRLRVVGIDQLPRPAQLPHSVAWWRDRWDTRSGSWTTGAADAGLAAVSGPALLIMCEWLDDLPAPLAIWHRQAWHEVCTDRSPAGVEDEGSQGSLACRGPALPDNEEQWARRWSDPERASIVGWTRDQAWSWAIGAVPAGSLVVAVDYGHRDGEDDGGLRGYVGGREVSPDPIRTMNITAGVALDSVAAAGEAAGARTVALARQSAMFAGLAPGPGPLLGSEDPLARLVRRGEHARLVDPQGWGGHWWLVQVVPAGTRTAPEVSCG
jgi:hypothetical protein